MNDAVLMLIFYVSGLATGFGLPFWFRLGQHIADRQWDREKLWQKRPAHKPTPPAPPPKK